MNPFDFLSNPEPWMVIVAMAVVTVLTRFSGYWLLGHRELSARTRAVSNAYRQSSVPVGG